MERDPIQTLEAAAQVLMAAPSQVSAEQRRAAEGVFLEFRASRSPYGLCRELLERPSSELVLLEAAGLLKASLVREWGELADADVASLRHYLLNYLLERDAPPFLREKLLQTIAIIVKRGSLEDGGLERRALLAQLEATAAAADEAPRRQRLACALVLALMHEYAVTVKSADVGLVWEAHFLAKKQFEAVDLKRIFRFTVGMLEQAVSAGRRPEGERAVLTRQLLGIAEAVLCWGQVSPLLPKRLIGAFEAVYESDSAPALRLSSNWKDTILQPELVALFFDLYLLVRDDPDLAGPALTCLVQLASLSGFVVNNKTVKRQYLETYVGRLLPVLGALQPAGRELLGVADIYRKLVQFFTPVMIAAMPPALFEHLTSLTCHCIRGAVIEEGTAGEDTVWREALGRLLDTWGALLHDSEFPRDALPPAAAHVFNAYLQARLAPPTGTRGTESGDGCSEEVRDDTEEDERRQHGAALATLGTIARATPAHAAHLLYTLLHDRSQRLDAQLQLLHEGKLPVGGGEQLVSLFEDLHWILMIAGHFLAVDCTEGETVLMPAELVHFSLQENCDVEASLRYMVEGAPADRVDPVLRLVSEILRLSAWEGAALAAGLSTAFSPELSATLSWLLKIWANSYLMPQQSLYSEMSNVLESAWGVHSSGAAWVISKLVSRVSSCLRHLHTQPAAAQQACQLLLTLAHIKDKQGRLASCEEFLALVAWEAAGSDLSGELRRELHKAFAVATTYAEGEARRRLLSGTVALQEKLSRLLEAGRDTEPARAALADTIDCYIGIAEGVHEVSRTDEQYLLLSGALEKVPGIVFRYHNYPGVVLPCFHLLARSAKRMLHSLEPQNADRFYSVCCAVLEVYERCSAGRVAAAALARDAEDDAYQDICVLMELVSSVGRCADWAAAGAARDAGAARVCARGLRLLLPLITPQLLLLPDLAHAAYRMLRDLDNADQICALPIEDFNSVMEALHVGLKAVSSDVAALCCDTIVGLASRVRTLGEEDARAHSLLSLAPPLLTLVIKMEMSAEALPAAGAALYALACVRPALLEGLARQLVAELARQDAARAPRLERAFAELAAGVHFDGARAHKLRFRDNFDKFLVHVHGFLVVK